LYGRTTWSRIYIDSPMQNESQQIPHSDSMIAPFVQFVVGISAFQNRQTAELRNGESSRTKQKKNRHQLYEARYKMTHNNFPSQKQERQISPE
jgi:hypothetical protein